MKKVTSLIVSIVMLLASLNVVMAESETQPVTGGENGGVYTFHIGNTDVSDAGAYDYADGYFNLRTSIGSNDSISFKNGISYQGGSCLEPPASAADSGRYILLKPKYAGTLKIKIAFPSSSSSAKGRIWANDFNDASFDTVDLTALQKGAGTQLGSDFAGSGAKTVSCEMQAGHTYSLHTYNRGSSITQMYYELNDPDAPVTTPSPTPEPTEQPRFEGERTVEYLDRGLAAVKIDGGVFLSWRLLGTEEIDTTYDIYKNGGLLVNGHNNTNYTDPDGLESDCYKVVANGGSAEHEKTVSVWAQDHLNVPISKPAPDPANTKAGTDYTYRANDASVADVDGDGEYEIILKWDPSNSKDNYFSGYTGNVYIDAYKMDGTMLWRIDLGVNVRAGAHYTQFIAYDFDGDGKAEIAMHTAPGSKDGKGRYVTEAGQNLLEGDNTKDYRDADGRVKTGPDYLTIFNGQTGEAMDTVDYFVQRGSLGSDGKWGGSGGDANSNYADRHLAGVAYVNGETPSLIMCRGYYYRAAVGVYNWNGTDLTLQWMRDDKEEGKDPLYAQGAHSLSIADVDNDGYDEIIYGAAVIDNDGSILNNTELKHGDALHVSDFNNDGKQEVFMAHEHSYRTHGAEYHDPVTGEVFAKVGATEDVGRGVMGNIIASNPYAEFWCSSDTNTKIYDLSGKAIADTRPAEINFLAWWDGDLTREVLDATKVVKYDIEDGKLVEKYRRDFFGTHSNNGTKQTPSLSADIFGDWREEVIYPANDNNSLRIYTTTIPSDYKITTLMHDTQYRCAVAWQNVGYNQPPHPSFYIGDEKTEYPSPKVKYAVVPDIEYNDPVYKTVMFNIQNGSGAEVYINGDTITADADGKANVTLAGNKAYEFTVRKSGFKTYSGLAELSGTDLVIAVALEAGSRGNVTVRFIDKLGNELKAGETAGEAGENEIFTVSEELFRDITAGDGTVYEFDPDRTKDITTRVEGDKQIDLVYKKKVVPVYGDTDITRINFGKNGFNKPVSSDNYRSSGEINYALFDDSENIKVDFTGALGKSYIIEYDILLPDMEEGGQVCVTPYSGGNGGTPMRFVRENGNTVLKLGDAVCTYTSEDLKIAGYNENQILRVVITGRENGASILLINRESSVVYVDYEDYNPQISGIDRLVFSGGGAGLGLCEIDSYTVGGATSVSYNFGGKINMTAPSQRSIVPLSAVHGTELEAEIHYPYKFSEDASFAAEPIDLTGGLSYALTELDGSNTNGDVTINNDGVITVHQNAAKRTVNVQILYDGHVFKTVPVHIVAGAVERFWTEDFEGDTHKFALSYNDSTHQAAEFHCGDPAKINAKEGKIYGVGARNGGSTGTNSSEIDTSSYSDISVEMDFKLDATSFNGNSWISLLGAKNEADSLGSNQQILTIKAVAGGGNGYWSEISVNGKVIISKIDDPNSSGETAGAGYDSSTKTIKFHALNRDSTGWLHLSAVPDFETQKVNVTITKISGGDMIYSGVLDFVDEVQELNYIFASGGRSYGTVWMDNIDVKGINPNSS